MQPWWAEESSFKSFWIICFCMTLLNAFQMSKKFTLRCFACVTGSSVTDKLYPKTIFRKRTQDFLSFIKEHSNYLSDRSVCSSPSAVLLTHTHSWRRDFTRGVRLTHAACYEVSIETALSCGLGNPQELCVRVCAAVQMGKCREERDPDLPRELN